jgi:hypothetical protein
MSFPTTPILDTGTRADENPLSDGGSWSTGVMVTGNTSVFRLVGNNFATIDTIEDSQYWSAATFGPDSEVYLEDHNPNTIGAHCRSQNENTTSLNGYSVFRSSVFLIQKFVNNSITTLSNTSLSGISGEVGIGLSAIGNKISNYYKKTGVWNLWRTVTDSAVTGVGHVGMIGNTGIAGQGFSANFGGGTAAPTGDSSTLTGAYNLQ